LPHPEERALARVSKDEAGLAPSSLRLIHCAIDLMVSKNFRSLEAVKGAHFMRVASGDRKPLTASRLRKQDAAMRSTALSAG
jgi:hypothetical protein